MLHRWLDAAIRLLGRGEGHGHSQITAHAKNLFADKHGVTTVGMAVSILVCLALVFSGAQLYRVGSAAAEVQEVADVAAMAAEGEVAEFMVVANAVDASILSMSLLACTAYGLGIVAACIPPCAGMSEQLLSAASKTVEARDRFAERAADGLNGLQKMLPFLAAANAASVVAANNDGAMAASYVAIGVLVPQQGEDIDCGMDAGLAELGDRIENSAPDIRRSAAQAEEAARKANESKERAYQHDCGRNPGYCQYERAGRFAWMPASENPLYSNVDAWSFSVALERAKAYYAERISNEKEPHGSVSERTSYHLRMIFYRYALEELREKGYVRDDGDAFDAFFPKLYRNTNEFRQTRLYNEAQFPISGASGPDRTMHAFAGCPAIGGISGYGPISFLDDGSCSGCGTCGFQLESLGNVASASTNIDNGFEHHYEQIRQALESYKDARAELEPLTGKVKGEAGPLLEALGRLMSEIAGMRIHPSPPGSNGAIAIVVNMAENRADTGFESSFARSGAMLGTRVAIAASTLVKDTTHDGSTIITSLLDGLDEGGGSAVGAARIVLDCWSGLLMVYEKGRHALVDAVERGLDSIPILSESGLGSWASSALEGAIRSVGLEPAEIKALKPALLNTGHVASSGDDAFATRFMQAKAASLSASSGSTSMLSAITASVSGAVTEHVSGMEVTIAEIDFPIGDAKIPIRITLPQSVGAEAGGIVSECLSAASGIVESAFGEKVWQ